MISLPVLLIILDSNKTKMTKKNAKYFHYNDILVTILETVSFSILWNWNIDSYNRKQ